MDSLVLGFCKCKNCGKEFFCWNTYFKCKECGGYEYEKKAWDEDLRGSQGIGENGSTDIADIFPVDDIFGS